VGVCIESPAKHIKLYVDKVQWYLVSDQQDFKRLRASTLGGFPGACELGHSG